MRVEKRACLEDLMFWHDGDPRRYSVLRIILCSDGGDNVWGW